MTYRQVVDHVKQRQRLHRQKMTKPEDDWFPEAYFLRATGRLSHQGIPTPWFNNRDSKEALVNEVFVPLVRWGGVRVFAFVVVMYMLEPEHPVAALIAERDEQGWESPTKGLPRFQDIEGSIEQLWVHVLDAERYEAWAARIIRPKRGRPQLAPFEMPTGPDMMTGMLDPVRLALR